MCPTNQNSCPPVIELGLGDSKLLIKGHLFPIARLISVRGWTLRRWIPLAILRRLLLLSVIGLLHLVLVVLRRRTGVIIRSFTAVRHYCEREGGKSSKQKWNA
jgi:hypothetical protein